LDTFKGSSAEFARSITNCGSSRVISQVPGCGPHDPDASFKYLGAQFPGVVIEVSHSQKKRDLPYLADDYILGSQSNIQRVVGLDIEYGGSKAKLATISTWVPGTTTDDGETALIAVQTVKSQVRIPVVFHFHWFADLYHSPFVIAMAIPFPRLTATSEFLFKTSHL